MRAIIQRCLNGAVVVNGEVIASIERGLVCLIGIGTSDTPDDSAWLAKKLVGLRLWNADLVEGKKSKPWSLSAKALDYDILLVSQFTLYGILKGNKPDFHNAMKNEKAQEFFDDFVRRVDTEYAKPKTLKKTQETGKIKTGVFGANMKVDLTNDGPVTIILDSHEHPIPRKGDGNSATAKAKTRKKKEKKAKAAAEDANSKPQVAKAVAEGTESVLSNAAAALSIKETSE